MNTFENLWPVSFFVGEKLYGYIRGFQEATQRGKTSASGSNDATGVLEIRLCEK